MSSKNKIQMQLMEHSLMSPSTLGKLISCPSFVSGPSTADAKRGTLLHSVMETGEGYDGLESEDQEQIDIAHARVAMLSKLYLDKDIKELEDLREQKLDTQIDDVWGTVDRVLIDLENKKILTIDYKFGMLQVEPVKSNFQALCYSLALFRKYPFISQIAFAFVHPALPENAGINAGVFGRDEMHLISEMILKETENIRFSEEVNASPNICKYCDKLTSCAAVREKVDLILRSGFGKNKITDDLIDAAKLSQEYSKKILDKAREMLEGGTVFERYKLLTVRKSKVSVTLGDVRKSSFTIDEDYVRDMKLTAKDLHMIIKENKDCVSSYFEKQGLIDYTDTVQMRSKTKRYKRK